MSELLFEGGVDKTPHVSSPAEVYDPIIMDQRNFTEILDRSSLQGMNSQRLANVSNTFQKAFSPKTSTSKKKTSQFLTRIKVDKNPHKCKKYYKTSIQNTIDKFRTSFKMAIDGGEDYSPPDMKKFRLPGPTSQEVDGVHPVMAVLLEAIADCCQQDFMDKDKDERKCFSPPQTGLVKEQLVAGLQLRKNRFCDLSVWKRGRHLCMMLDSSIQLTVEIKPGQRTNKNPMQLFSEARDQCLSHAAKSLLSCLRFAKGAGVPSQATSVLCSLAGIEIIQLQLIDPGKMKARVEMVSTGLLPLLNQSCFDEWYASDLRGIHKDAVDKLRGSLYPQDGNDNDGTPLGIRALYQLMMSSRSFLIGPEWNHVSSELSNLLGTGTFGMVFDAAKNKEVAVKISKSDIRHFIEREGYILKYLTETKDTTPDSVPTFVSYGYLNVSIGGLTSPLPALAMKPVCEDFYAAMSRTRNSIKIKDVLMNIKEALTFIHKNGISHNDVNDRNILLRQSASGKWCGVLVDYSIASEMSKVMKNFQGTPQFVHHDIHNNHQWCPVPEYDMTSLGLTIAVFFNRGVIPWKDFGSVGKKNTGICNSRMTAAKEIINNQNDDDLMLSMKDLLLCGNIDYYRACKCKMFTRDGCGCDRLRCGCAQKEKQCTPMCGCFQNNSSPSGTEHGTEQNVWGKIEQEYRTLEIPREE
eukprot:scaffold1076_cov32-Attheya_sp.AAC.1